MQKSRARFPVEEVKMNNKNYLINTKESRKEQIDKKQNKTKEEQKKTNSKLKCNHINNYIKYKWTKYSK